MTRETGLFNTIFIVIIKMRRWYISITPLIGLLAIAEGLAAAALSGQGQQASPNNVVVANDVSSSTATTTTTTGPAPPAFTYDRTSFLLHGEPHVLIGGQMDPQRIPRAYWRDRLSKARAMGLNTIFTYVFWNLLEPEPGLWLNGSGDDDDGLSSILSNDIATYFRIAHEEGLNVVLRPGPYICGEREWGGFPYWLSTVPEMQVRANNDAFLGAAQSYLERLADDLRDLQVSRGGPLLMVQVENEYGSYGEDHAYTAAVRDILLENFEVPLYTNDGGVEWTLEGGSVPGVLAAIDGDPIGGFAARDQYITDPSMLGPLLDGEYYSVWADFWGEGEAHNTAEGKPDTVEKLVSDLDFVLGANNSISLYMFHGGTNFGLSNGAIWRNGAGAIFTTSYDYGAPLDESGRTTELYFAFRDAIAQYTDPTNPNTSIPDPPANVPLLNIANFTLEPTISLFDTNILRAAKKTPSEAPATSPATMEQLGQAYGFVLYEHIVTTTTANASYEGILQPGDRPRDRVLVYVNGLRVGVIDGTYATPAEVRVSLTPGDVLWLLVENLGRVDYWSRESGTFVALEDPFKGVQGDVTVGGVVVEGWDMYSLPVDTTPDGVGEAVPAAGGSPFFYRGTFDVPAAAAAAASSDGDPAALDTFLAIPDGIKGIVWVNGFNLGRYWVVGPQQSLYLPGVLLKGPGEGPNEVVVLELEPTGSEPLTAFGTAERSWGNRPDPDYE